MFEESSDSEEEEEDEEDLLEYFQPLGYYKDWNKQDWKKQESSQEEEDSEDSEEWVERMKRDEVMKAYLAKNVKIEKKIPEKSDVEKISENQILDDEEITSFK